MEGVLSRVVTRGLTEKKQLDSNDLRERCKSRFPFHLPTAHSGVLADVAFLTAENSHNDTYANTYHRMFFANWVQKKPLSACPDNDGHNVDAIDAMTNVVPCALLALQQGPEAVEAAAKAVTQSFWRASLNSGVLLSCSRCLCFAKRACCKGMLRCSRVCWFARSAGTTSRASSRMRPKRPDLTSSGASSFRTR